MKVRTRKPRFAVNKRRHRDPRRSDPTRTLAIRKAFCHKLSVQFDGLKVDVLKLMDGWPQPTSNLAVVDSMTSNADKILDWVADVRQRDHFSCGAACALSVYKGLGLKPDLTLEKMKKELGTDVEESTHPQTIIDFFRGKGCSIEAKDGLTVDDLAGSISRGSPIVVCVQDYGPEVPAKARYKYGHYLVVIGVIGEEPNRYVLAQDPSEDNVIAGGDEGTMAKVGSIQVPGRIVVREDDWMRLWHDEDVDGNKYVRFGITIGKPTVINVFDELLHPRDEYGRFGEGVAVTKDTAEAYSTKFDVGEQTFSFHAEKETGEVEWGVAFVKGEYNLPTRYKQLHDPNTSAVEVLNKVGHSLDMFIIGKSPNSFGFSSDMSETGRTKLYDRLARKLSSKYGYGLKTEDLKKEHLRLYTFHKLTANDWVTLESGQHVYIDDQGNFQPSGPKGGSSGKRQGGAGERGRSGEDVRKAQGAGKGLAGPTEKQSGSAAADQERHGQGQSTGDKPAQSVPRAIEEVNHHLDRYADFFRKKGQHEVAGWMDKLKDHVNTVGVQGALESLGQEKVGKGLAEVHYGGSAEDISGFARSYLDRHGINVVHGDENPSSTAPMLSSVTPQFTGKDVRGLKGDFTPASPTLKDKLEEAKRLPGLEKSEDIGKVAGGKDVAGNDQKVTHLAPEVTKKLDERYGKDKWIVKPYGEEAFSSYGIFFPQRVRQLQTDAQSTLWNAGQHLDKYGFKLARNGNTGQVEGLVHSTGDTYRFGSPEYENTIHGDARHWADQAKAAADHEGGPKLPEGSFMAQPAFAAVGVSDAERAAGKALAPGEGRVHVTTAGGKAQLVPHSTWIKGEHLPVVFENEDTKAMAKAATDAINALPKSERQGQVYAPDIIKTADGYRVVEANPSNESGASGYLGDNPLIIDSYVSHLTNREPAHVKFIRGLLSKRPSRNEEGRILHWQPPVLDDPGYWVGEDCSQWFTLPAPTANAFCATGKGGGIDSSCGGSGSAKERADDAEGTEVASSGAVATSHSIISRFKAQYAKLAGKSVLKQVDAANRFMAQKSKQLYDALEKRYGRRQAIAIIASAQGLAWGATGVGAAFGVPVWLPGSTIWGSLPAVGLAELHLRLRKAFTKNELEWIVANAWTDAAREAALEARREKHVYHGTHEGNLKGILAGGLRPGSDKLVHGTTSYAQALGYAVAGARVNGGHAVVVSVSAKGAEPGGGLQRQFSKPPKIVRVDRYNHKDVEKELGNKDITKLTRDDFKHLIVNQQTIVANDQARISNEERSLLRHISMEGQDSNEDHVHGPEKSDKQLERGRKHDSSRSSQAAGAEEAAKRDHGGTGSTDFLTANDVNASWGTDGNPEGSPWEEQGTPSPLGHDDQQLGQAEIDHEAEKLVKELSQAWREWLEQHKGKIEDEGSQHLSNQEGSSGSGRVIGNRSERVDPPSFIVNALPYDFPTDPQRIDAFKQWLKSKIAKRLRTKAIDKLWKEYCKQGYRKGAARAFDDAKAGEKAALGADKLDWYAGTRDEFLRSAFGQPVAVERVKRLAERSLEYLDGVTDQMAETMHKILLDGLVEGKGTLQIGRELAKRVDVGKSRAFAIAQTECIRAHSQGQLDSFKNLRIEEVGVAVEFDNAHDDLVCERCSALEGMVLKVDEADGLIPVHTRCRCCWLPWLGDEGKAPSAAATRSQLADGELDEVEVDDVRPKGVLNESIILDIPDGQVIDEWENLVSSQQLDPFRMWLSQNENATALPKEDWIGEWPIVNSRPQWASEDWDDYVTDNIRTAAELYDLLHGPNRQLRIDDREGLEEECQEALKQEQGWDEPSLRQQATGLPTKEYTTKSVMEPPTKDELDAIVNPRN